MLTGINENSIRKLSKKHHILGVGTPIVDYLLNVSDEYLNSLPGLRGGSVLVDHQTFQKILKDHPSIKTLIAGGSTANTIKGLTQLGYSCAFVGKIGPDDAGKHFTESIESHGIITHLSLSQLLSTAQVACLITPDFERTMRTYIGAGAELNESDLTPELFKDAHLVHIEGYLMNRKGVVEKAMKLAKEAGAKISFDLSSFEIVEEYKKSMTGLLSEYVDIVFANEQEAQMLTGLTPEKACMIMRDLSDIAVVKTGSLGSWAATKNEVAFHRAYPVKVIDTTGAGDLFASGFLHGFLLKKSLEESLRYGSLVASHVIQAFGAEIPSLKWEEIRKNL